MSNKINDVNFFKNVQPPREETVKKTPQKEAAKKTPKQETVKKTPKSPPVVISNDLRGMLRNTAEMLTRNQQRAEAEKINKIYKDAVRDRFSVAVVGEFSRGKSTFINTFLNRKFLPVGDMPTTSMLTRIRYNKQERFILFDDKGRKVKNFPLSQDSWEGLTAQNLTGEDYRGTVLAGVNVSWLSEYNVELIDTPGAGDLEERRAQIIGEALLGSDGAIITISATSALSMSEKLFIEQRLLTRKTPFLMLVVTKLDQISLEQRSDVVNYILNKLELWNMKIPVYIPYKVKMPDQSFDRIMGLDKVKNQIVSWINEPQRVKLTEIWIASRTVSVLDTLLSSLNEQKLLLCADDSERENLLKEKRQQLLNAELAWGDLKIKMQERGNACYSLLINKADEYKAFVTEKLQYEASRSNNPQKWWNEDYPYRLKIELANVSTGIENIISRQIMEDARWFNTALEKNFKTHVLYEKSAISEKELFQDSQKGKDIEFEDIAKQRSTFRVATTVLSVAGAFVCAATGFLTVVATMGINTGAGLISEKIFKGKIEKQQESIKAAIAKSVPRIVDDAVSESEKRVNAVYEDMIKSATEKEESWLAAQKEIMEKSSSTNKNNSQLAELDSQLRKLEELKERFEKYSQKEEI